MRTRVAFLAGLLAAFGTLASLVALLRRGRLPLGGTGRGGPPPAGVREPRRPLQPTGFGAAAVDPRDG